MSRTSVPIAARREVKRRAAGRCERCGAEQSLILHHRVRVKAGGDHSARNLEALCRPCHDAEHRAAGDRGRPRERLRFSMSIRLTPEAKRLLEALALKLGGNLSAAMEYAIRDAARREKVEIGDGGEG